MLLCFLFFILFFVLIKFYPKRGDNAAISVVNVVGDVVAVAVDKVRVIGKTAVGRAKPPVAIAFITTVGTCPAALALSIIGTLLLLCGVTIKVRACLKYVLI